MQNNHPFYLKTKIIDNLKLPLCPKCNETKYVEEINCSMLLYVHDYYPWYKCNICGIKWHAEFGVRKPNDTRQCFT